MTTFALTVSTSDLGLGVISGARVAVDRKRTQAADAFSFQYLGRNSVPTNSLGVATILLEPDDGSVYHEIKIFDLVGILVYSRIFTMPPQAVSISDLPVQDVVSASAAAVLESVATATAQAVISTAQAAISTAQAVISTEQAVIATTQAGIATTQAGLATTNGEAQVVLAEAQAALATAQAVLTAADRVQTGLDVIATNANVIATEAARDAANTIGKVFANTALGIAGTTNGQSFSVLSGDLQDSIVYTNAAGTATELFRIKTSAFIEALGLDPSGYNRSGYAAAWLDSNSRLALGINNAGKVIFGKGGDISQRLDVAEKDIEVHYSYGLDVLSYGDRSGYAAAWLDSNSRLALGINNAGKVIFGKGGDISQRLDVAESAINGFAPSPLSAKGSVIESAAKVADLSNPLYKHPLKTRPAWAASTAYLKGQQVTNLGNWYSCSIAGTSALSGGPSVTTLNEIEDGTVTWHFVSRAVIAVDDIEAPVVTMQTNGAVAGLDRTMAYNSPAFTFFGCNPVDISGAAYRFATIVSGGSNFGVENKLQTTGRIKFETDAPKFSLLGGVNTESIQVLIDGRYLGAPLYPNGAGTPNHFILDFNGVRKRRTVIIEFGYGFEWRGVAIDTYSRIWKSAPTSKLSLAWIGDSFVQGTQPVGPHAGYYGSEWPSLVAKMLGIDDVWNMGIGGTGFVKKSSSGTLLNYLERVSDLSQKAFDIVVINSSVNDGGELNATITANCTSMLQTARSLLPNALIFVTGIVADPANNFFLQASNASYAGFIAAQDDLMFWIPTALDTPTGEAWSTGNGSANSPNGSGNHDFYHGLDWVHPNSDGLLYYAERVSNAIRTIIAT